MKVCFNAANNSYSISELTYNEVLELTNVLESCDLPNRRTFYKLQNEIKTYQKIKNG